MLGLGATLGVAALALVAQFGAWAPLYLIELPRHHALEFDGLGGFWFNHLLPFFGLALVVSPLYLIGCFVRRDLAALRFWSLAIVGLLGLALSGALNRWSADNVLVPACAVLSAMFGLGLREVLGLVRGTSPTLRAYRGYVLVLVLFQLGVVHYNPRESSPLRSDVWASQRLVERIAQLPGPVFGPDVSEFVRLAGKGDQAFGLSTLELFGGFGGTALPESRAWLQAYAQALQERRYGALLLDPDSVESFLAGTARDNGYVDTGPLFPPGDEFYLWRRPITPQPHLWLPQERVLGR